MDCEDETHKVVTRFLNFIGASNHIADQDIWEFIFNSNTPKIKFAYIRDYSNQLIFAGYVQAYSDRSDLREIAMYQVEVFTEKSEKLYATPYLYLARAPEQITLEFPVEEKIVERKGWWQGISAWWKKLRTFDGQQIS